MNTVIQVIRQRRRRKQRDHRNPLPHSGWIAATLISLSVTLLIFGIGWITVDLLRDLPPIETVEILLNSQNGSLKTPTRFLDREGKTVLATLENPAMKRIWLDLPTSATSLPTITLDSPLARVLFAVLESNSPPKSTFNLREFTAPQLNTLAERLAYELLLWNETNGWRKILRAKILGAQINQRYGKLQTLVWYLNSAQFGPLVYGAETAAQLYFHKSAAELNVLESASLVSILDNPAIHPFNAPEVVRKRTGDILVRILKSGWLKGDEIAEVDLNKLDFATPKVLQNEIRPTYVDLTLQQLAAAIPRAVIERGGWEIVTTLDADLQHNLECTLALQMSRLTQGGDLLAPQLGDCPAALLLPGVSSAVNPSNFPLKSQGLILDPTTNQILAIASLAQTDQAQTAIKYAPLEKHVAGTILTPFVYLAAFSRGIQPATLQWDIPREGATILPNLGGKYHGPVRARIALANDYFSAAFSLYTQIGSEIIQKVIRQLGVSLEYGGQTSESGLSAQQFFFSAKVSVLEIAQAYQVLANQGMLVGWRGTQAPLQGSPQVSPALILKVKALNGQELLEPRFDQSILEKRSAISSELAYLVTNVLADEAARWQTFGHPNPFEIGRRSAAKLGRVVDPNQYWTVGYTPHRLVAVWLGNEQGQQTILKPSSVMNLWHALMQYSSKELPPSDWSMPDQLLEMTVCDPSGMLPDEDCPSTVHEIFISGFEPHQTDQLYQTTLINEQNGRLATVFTPLELVKEQRFLTIPPEAHDWAVREGLPMPPAEYDLIQAPPHQSENVRITSPQMFSYVRGVVDLLGSAAGDDFQYYRLQVGEGLFPRRWIQLGADHPLPVKGSKLGSWDTQGLSGLFTLQLQVVGKENRVETALLQLTVDNTPPTVSIIVPAPGISYSHTEFPTLTFQIQAEDNLAMQKVELSLDGRKIHTFTKPPYAFPWQTTAGSHRVLVVGYDVAGNSTAAEIVFTITR